MAGVTMTTGGNTNLNAMSSTYSKKYGHNETDAISRALAGRKKKKRKKSK